MIWSCVIPTSKGPHVFIEKVCGNCVDKNGRAKKGGTATGKVIRENNMIFTKDGAGAH
jgi:hypothetical protein